MDDMGTRPCGEAAATTAAENHELWGLAIDQPKTIVDYLTPLFGKRCKEKRSGFRRCMYRISFRTADSNKCIQRCICRKDSSVLRYLAFADQQDTRASGILPIDAESVGQVTV